jgi:SAM-dependent methyltransferase
VRPGTQGYDAQAPELVPRYESASFEDVHAGIVDLVPPSPCRVLDIGAGSGRDAAWFAARGDVVTAVEPTRGMRERGQAAHPSPRIEWIDDGLPDLQRVRGRTFDLVWISAVWFHLTAEERAEAMPVVAALVGDGGALMLSLRHAPPAPGRRMFEVNAEEPVAQAEATGLLCVRNVNAASRLEADKHWDRLWFRRAR